MGHSPRAATAAQILAAVEGLRDLLVQRQDMFQLAQVALERMIQVEDRMQQLVEQMERIERIATHRHQIADKRMERVDKYVLDEAFDVQGTNAQMISSFNALRQQLFDLAQEVKRELRQNRSAIELQLGGEELTRTPRRKAS